MNTSLEEQMTKKLSQWLQSYESHLLLGSKVIDSDFQTCTVKFNCENNIINTTFK